MFDSALGFGLLVSTLTTFIVYVITRDKNKSEQQQKDKMNDMIILCVITFIVTLFGKLCLGEKPSTTLIKATEIKGGQCPF